MVGDLVGDRTEPQEAGDPGHAAVAHDQEVVAAGAGGVDQPGDGVVVDDRRVDRDAAARVARRPRRRRRPGPCRAGPPTGSSASAPLLGRHLDGSVDRLAAVVDPSVPTRIFVYIGRDVDGVGAVCSGASPASGPARRRRARPAAGVAPSTARKVSRFSPLVDSGSSSTSTMIICAGAELLVEQPLGQRILDQALDGPAQRAGAERRVVAPVGQEELGRVGELDAEALALELGGAPA